MGFWFVFWVFVASMVVGELLRPRPKDATASGLGDFRAPTAEEGRAIPVVFGTCKIAGPNVVWYGDLSVNPIEKSSGFLFKSTQTVGYKYYLGMHLALCHGPVDALLQVLAQDREVPLQGGSGGLYTLDGEKLFGGEDREGGIQGPMAFYAGTATQSSDPYLQAQLQDVPGFRGLCHLVLKHIYVGTSNYLKDLAFVVRRLPRPAALVAQNGDHSDISGDANPAYVVFEILTNTVWGLGITDASLDLASFAAAASTLRWEGLGVSIMLDTQAEARQAIEDILRHIDGTLYADPATGKLTLALARKDYDPATLPKLDTSSVAKEGFSFGRPSWAETVNEVKIRYVSRAAGFQERVEQAQDLANQGIQGHRVSESIAFHGFTTAANGQKVAMRSLKTLSYPLAKVHLLANRRAWNLRPGSVFKLDWAPLGITGLVLRVTRIAYGELHGRPGVEIDAVEDIFSVAATAYAPASGSSWTDPLAAPPSAPAAVRIIEAPWFLAGEERWAIPLVARGDGASMGFEVWTDHGSGAFFTNRIGSFTPSGILTSAQAIDTPALDTTGITVAPAADLGRLASTDSTGLYAGRNLLLIGDELMAWQTVTLLPDGTYRFANLLRGILDTVPAAHATGERVWFLDGVGATTRESYAANASPNVSLLPFTLRQTFALGAASSHGASLQGRAFKPYPPGNVRINGQAYPTTITGDAVITWAHRNRAAGIVAQDAPSAPQGPEGTVDVEVWIGGTLRRSFTGLTGTGVTYTAAMRAADDGDPAKTVVFRLTTRNGVQSGQARVTAPIAMG